MSVSVTMPQLGESVTEGTVTRWLKQEGDRVEVDEPLLEVSTDKVDTEIPSPAAGTLTKITANEDDTVEVGGELAVIGDGGDDTGSSPAPDSATASASTPGNVPSAAPAPTTDAPAPSQESLIEHGSAFYLGRVGECRQRRHPDHDASPRRICDRRNGDPLAQAGRRPRCCG